MIVIVITIVGLMVARTILVIPAELVVLKNQVTKRMQLCITEWEEATYNVNTVMLFDDVG